MISLTQMNLNQRNLQAVPFDDSLVKPDDCLPGFDMVSEQNKDDELLELKTILVHG